jgi:hypothetical protein
MLDRYDNTGPLYTPPFPASPMPTPRAVPYTLGFTEAKSNTSLFVYRHDANTAYLLLYVDDIVLTASSPKLLQCTARALQQ